MERNKKKLVETLTRGKNSAKRLQDILHQKVNDDGLVSVDDLVTEISESFYGGLLVLSSCNSGDLCRVPVSPHLPEVCSGKKPVTTVKEHRRGCYKRRKTIDSRTEISGTIEDGYAWRKYGQKEILNSKFPRCYFRCTQKHVHGCKALKQVQKMEDESNMFHITYFGYHTCLSTPNTFSHPSIPSIITDFHFDPSLKKEDVCDDISLANEQSSHALVWSDILIDDCESFKNDGVLSDVSFDDVLLS